MTLAEKIILTAEECLKGEETAEFFSFPHSCL